jgi:hypothetical protein
MKARRCEAIRYGGLQPGVVLAMRTVTGRGLKPAVTGATSPHQNLRVPAEVFVEPALEAGDFGI